MSLAEETASPQAETVRRVQDWWKTLGGENRAARARLRRATVPEAACDEAALDLCRRLGLGWAGLPKVARLACVLAHVREDDRRPFAQAVGRSGGGEDSAALSSLRFRHLLTATDDDDVVRGFRRAVAIAGGRASVRDLTQLLMGWEQDRIRTRFAFDYYTPDRPAEKGPAA